MGRITIIGMGPIGTSIGLALKRANLKEAELVGSSGNREALAKASKLGAVDKTIANLRSATDGANLVILDTPLSETRDILEAVGPYLEDGCTVTDTGASKIRVLEWVDEYLPEKVSFVGGHPLLKKQPLSVDDADAALFDGAHYCVIPAKSADESSVKTVVGLVEALGAKPLFMDPHEHDSYAAAMTHLPMVLSSAFVTATTGSDGWKEMRRLAGSEFGEISRLAENDPQDNEAACLVNSDALVIWLDQLIKELYWYRNQIKEPSDELLDIFVKAWEARARWEIGVGEDDGRPGVPAATGTMATLFFGERLVDRYKQVRGDDKKKDGWKYPRRG